LLGLHIVAQTAKRKTQSFIFSLVEVFSERAEDRGSPKRARDYDKLTSARHRMWHGIGVGRDCTYWRVGNVYISTFEQFDVAIDFLQWHTWSYIFGLMVLRLELKMSFSLFEALAVVLYLGYTISIF